MRRPTTTAMRTSDPTTNRFVVVTMGYGLGHRFGSKSIVFSSVFRPSKDREPRFAKIPEQEFSDR